MKTKEPLHDPWLTAVWPGMGAVAISAGYYLMAKLGMHLLAEFPAGDYFDAERIEVKHGLIRAGRLPRSRLFLWHDPHRRHDLIVFIGEAQPPAKGRAFCGQVIGHAADLGVERVYTFAAMATQMRPEHPSRVFGAAIDFDTLAEFKRLNVQPLEEGHISGLNGVLLGVAAENGMRGGCLLGEMPQVFSQFPFPKAALSVLKIFSSMADIQLDTQELQTHSRQVDKGLTDFLHRLENSVSGAMESASPFGHTEQEHEPTPNKHEAHLKPADVEKIEAMFAAARKDRTRAYELKQELDRLKVFDEYEDQFLDLFKEPH